MDRAMAKPSGASICSGGEWEVVEGLPIDEFSQKAMDTTKVSGQQYSRL